MSDTTLLKVANVVSGYGKMAVLHEVSMEVRERELVAVIGPNGAGKTTLMDTIMGVIYPMQGDIFFKGETIKGLQPYQIITKGISYVPQRGNVFPGMTVSENLEMGGCLLKSLNNRLDYVYGLFPVLKERKNQKASTLSGGERQMLAIGSALMLKPDLLVLDEPTTGLAPQIRQQVIDAILQIKHAGTALIWVVEEHPRQVLPYADRVYILESGVIRKTSAGRELLEDQRFDELFMGR